jgi:hypothetical protein
MSIEIKINDEDEQRINKFMEPIEAYYRNQDMQREEHLDKLRRDTDNKIKKHMPTP